MAKPKYAGKKHKQSPAPSAGVLVPRDAAKDVVLEAIANNPELQRYAALTTMHVLQTWSALATVDVNEIVRLEKRSCRFCHGIDHRYQWATEDEWADECARRLDLGKETPGCEGGFGFDPRLQPHSQCPRCHGDGDTHIHVADYREMSPAARLLFNGVKWTKHGPEIQLRDRDRLLELAGKHLGMFKERIEHSGKNGSPITFLLTRDEERL